MKLISQTNAKRLLALNSNLIKIKWDAGKYDWQKRKSFAEREHQVGDQVVAIWLERRQDRHGPYALIMCARHPYA